MVNASILIDVDNIIRDDIHPYLLEKVGDIPNKKGSVGLILVLSRKKVFELEHVERGQARIKYLNSPAFINSIIGSCYTVYNKRKGICEILNPDGDIIKDVVKVLMTHIPAKTTLWLRVPLHSHGFSKIIDSAIASGFSHPYICNKSPLGDEESKSLCLYCLNHYTGKKNIDKVRNEVDYVLSQQDKAQCVLVAKFDPKTVSYLQRLCTTGASPNGDGSLTQKEIAGALKVSLSKKKGVFIVSINKDSLSHGGEEGVDVAKSRFNFHTHPKEAYARHNVKNGWPSYQDYIGFVDALETYDTVFHVVITLEGVYIISLKPFWVGKALPRLSSFIKKHYDHFKVDITVSEYLSRVNRTLYKGNSLFSVSYLTWKEVKKGKMFSVVYPKVRDKVGENCFVSNEDFIGYFKIYK